MTRLDAAEERKPGMELEFPINVEGCEPLKALEYPTPILTEVEPVEIVEVVVEAVTLREVEGKERR